MNEEAEIAAWLAGQAERTIETSCARVFLQPDRALKMKRRVDLGFLDFTTLEKRRWAIERELAFNRAYAPDIYRGVHAVTRSPAGGLALDGDGEPVDYLLEMRRFDERRVLAETPEAVDGALAEALGRLIARAQAAAPSPPGAGGLGALSYVTASNAEVLRGLTDTLGSEAVEALLARTEAALARLGPLLDARKAAGFGRRCHADLHLGNILLEGGRPVLFDCIEFNDAISDIDVQYDVAFLLMDLTFRGRADAAVRVLSAWLDESARTFGPAVFDGLAALPLMLAVRAAVRAHVSAHAGDAPLGRAYLTVSGRHLSPAPPRLVAVGGLSGSGKSTFARAIAPHIGAAPGALVLRTDEVRKRLAGAGPLERLPPQAYAPEAQARTYAAAFDAAERALKAGWGVVLDATFIDADLRARAEAAAQAAGVPFEGVWLTAPETVLAERVGGRTADASDAGLDTLRSQLRRDPGPLSWRDLSTEHGSETAAQAWASARDPERAK